jgi:HAD superfamily hydrolase (TIGR01509 family)
MAAQREPMSSDMYRPELIIFDCDGVLIDSEPLASRTLSEALRGAGVDLSPAQVHHDFTGKPEAEIRRLCVEEHGLEDDETVFTTWHETLFAAFARDLRPMAGMLELVRSIEGAKCVASNSLSTRLQASLGGTPLWAEFAPHIFGADTVARPKPAPDLLLLCAGAVGVSPDRGLMIDDSPHGITAAREAGMKAIGFVDPADPRPDRAGVLREAGAIHVALGAAELGSILHKLDCPMRNLPQEVQVF